MSENARPAFSKDDSKLLFGIAPTPILPDTNLLEEKIVNVEVWSYTEGRLHTRLLFYIFLQLLSYEP